MIAFRFDLTIDETAEDAEEQLFYALNRVLEKLPVTVSLPALSGLLAQDLCTAVVTDGQPDDFVDRVLTIVKQEANEGIETFRKSRIH